METISRRIRNWTALVLFLVVLGTAREAYAYNVYTNGTFASEDDCIAGAISSCTLVCRTHSEPYSSFWCVENIFQHPSTWIRECECGTSAN
jgi:hypothetical protein